MNWEKGFKKIKYIEYQGLNTHSEYKKEFEVGLENKVEDQALIMSSYHRDDDENVNINNLKQV